MRYRAHRGIVCAATPTPPAARVILKAVAAPFPPRPRAIAAKPIQIILARQLASILSMPILIVDTDARLVYYNEPAEAILGQRFDETGEIAADTWSTLFAIEDEERRPIAQEDRPTMLALSERRPFSRTVWMRCGNREWRHISITAFPLIGEAGQFLGAQMIFWET